MSTQDEPRTHEAWSARPKRAKRRRKLIKGKLQLSLAAIFAGLSTLALLLQSLAFGAMLANAADNMPVGGEYLLDLMPTLLGWSVVFALGVVVPLTVAVGITTSFRLVGPVHRFEEFLREVIRGRQAGPCKIRDKDAFADLCGLINQATEPLRRRTVTDTPQGAADTEGTAATGS